MSALPGRAPNLDQERSFGRAVGLVLAAIGGWSTFRAWPAANAVGVALMAVGLSLVVFALLAPSVLTLPARWWMALAHMLGWVSTRVVLSLFFYIVLTPFGLIRRWTGADPLDHRKPARATFWTPYPARQRDPKYYERMF